MLTLVPNNPETFVERPSFETISEALTKPEISFDEWKRVAIEEKGKKKNGHENRQGCEIKRRIHVTSDKSG